MSDSPCPSVAHVVAQADGGLARVRLPGGRLTADQLAVVADAARHVGTGVIEITNRANLQLRGIDPAETGRLASALVAAGLSAGEAGDRRRNLLAGPLAGLDPTEVTDVGPLVPAILARLDAEATLDGLSPKFGVVLDGGGRWHLGDRRDDVVVTARRVPGGACRFDVHAAGRTVGDVAPDGVPDAVCAAAVAAVGAPARRLSGGGTVAPVAGPLGVGDQTDPDRTDADRRWVGVMPVLGRMDAVTALGVAGLADRYAAGRLRLTPWRGIVLGDVPAHRADATLDAAAALGLLTRADDPATAVVTCAGRGCPASRTDTVADARAVIAGRRRDGAGVSLVHVSGCDKRCAHRPPAPLTLVGVGAGRYDLLVADGAAPGGERLLAASVPAGAAVATATRFDTARPDPGRHEANCHDTTRPDTTRPDTSRHEANCHDTTRPDTTRPTTSGVR